MKINKNILLILSGLVVAIAPQAQEIKVKDKNRRENGQYLDCRYDFRLQ